MYCSLLLLSWGTFFKLPSWWGFFISILTSVFLYATARIEEKENIITFGLAYREYMDHTKMFIPYLL
jgi:protein-S-isoprenylcysteine O-methyltransferase Ste14